MNQNGRRLPGVDPQGERKVADLEYSYHKAAAGAREWALARLEKKIGEAARVQKKWQPVPPATPTPKA